MCTRRRHGARPVPCGVPPRPRTLGQILRRARRHATASSAFRECAEAALTEAAREVHGAQPAQISRWLRSSDPMVLAFVIEHLARQ
jgi:hypothetical protein